MEIEYKPSKTKAILGKFTNGALKKKAADKVKFACFDHNTNKKDAPIGSPKINSDKKILVAEANGLRYIGYNHGILAGSAKGLTRYMLGVHDKTTGKMRIYDADMFNMRPEQLDNTEAEDDGEKTFIEKNDALTSAFGSTRKKKAMASRQKNKLKDYVLKEVVGDAVDSALLKPEAEQLIAPAKAQKSASDIPPYNEDAEKPQDVYSLNSIITGAEMDSMKGPAQDFVNSTKEDINVWESEKRYPLYVIEHLRVMPINEEARLQRASCLLYVCYMMHMYAMSIKVLKQRDPFPSELKMPGAVKRRLLTMFTVTPVGSNQRMMTKQQKDKLLCYLLVLCLIIDEFNMAYISLMKDLKLPEKQLKTFFRALACKVTTSKRGSESLSAVTLPIPVVFPDITKGRDKKKMNK